MSAPSPYVHLDRPGDTALARAEYVRSLGVNPEGRDDNEFGTTWIYCGSHREVHTAGWCHVDNAMKTPLEGITSEAEGRAKVREWGFILYRDSDSNQR
jgi:hypothetical protein